MRIDAKGSMKTIGWLRFIVATSAESAPSRRLAAAYALKR